MIYDYVIVMTRMQTFFTDVQHYDLTQIFFRSCILNIVCMYQCNCEHEDFGMTAYYTTWIGIENLFQKKFILHRKFICGVINTVIMFWNQAAN